MVILHCGAVNKKAPPQGEGLQRRKFGSHGVEDVGLALLNPPPCSPLDLIAGEVRQAHFQGPDHLLCLLQPRIE